MPPDDDFGIDQRRMPFTSHLVELRGRVLICVLAVLVGSVAFFFVRKQLVNFMTLPVKRAVEATDGRVKMDDIMFSKAPLSMFMTSCYVALVAAIALTIPVTVYELWAFVAPGLKRRERRLVGPVIVSSFVLFLLGAAFCYFVVLRVMLGFFLQDTVGFEGVKPFWSISDLIGFEALLMLVFGVTFETPLVVVALTKIGILTPEAIAKKRRHAILVIFIICAVVTPTPDPFTMTLMAVPLIILFEIGIQLGKFLRPRRSRWDAFDASVAADEAAHASAKAAAPVAEPPAAPAAETGESVYTEPADAYGEGATYAEQQAETPYVEPPGHEDEGAAPEPPGDTPAEPDHYAPAPEEPPEEPEHKPQPPPDDDLPPDAIMH